MSDGGTGESDLRHALQLDECAAEALLRASRTQLARAARTRRVLAHVRPPFAASFEVAAQAPGAALATVATRMAS